LVASLHVWLLTIRLAAWLTYWLEYRQSNWWIVRMERWPVAERPT